MALDGIRILEFSHAMAGRFCGGLLADFGAEVIKVERRDTDDSMRRMGPKGAGSFWFAVNSRNKRSIEVDLEDPGDNAYVKRRVASSNPIIENYRPGAVERCGPGWKEVGRINPRVVMLRISGFGRGGSRGDRHSAHAGARPEALADADPDQLRGSGVSPGQRADRPHRNHGRLGRQ